MGLVGCGLEVGGLTMTFTKVLSDMRYEGGGGAFIRSLSANSVPTCSRIDTDPAFSDVLLLCVVPTGRLVVRRSEMRAS